MKTSTKKIAYLGLCTTVALVFAYVESLLPPLFAAVPGIKIGLPNIAIIFTLYKFGLKEASAVSLVRMVLVASMFGNPTMFLYSLAGAILSMVAMALLKKSGFLSSVGVSVAGGVFHNLGQIILAAIILETAEIGYYMIVLSFAGIISGIFVGICGNLAVKRISIKFP